MLNSTAETVRVFLTFYTHLFLLIAQLLQILQYTALNNIYFSLSFVNFFNIQIRNFFLIFSGVLMIPNPLFLIFLGFIRSYLKLYISGYWCNYASNKFKFLIRGMFQFLQGDFIIFSLWPAYSTDIKKLKIKIKTIRSKLAYDTLHTPWIR